MFCAKCQNDLVDCVCSDIGERLKRLLENPLTQLAGGMNILARQAKQAEKRLVEAEALLAEVEWTKFNSGGMLWQFCPYCNSVKRDSAWHKAGCKLAAFLKDVDRL